MGDAKRSLSETDAEIAEPRPMRVGLVNGGTAATVCVRPSAMNAFGGYIGLRTSVFLDTTLPLPLAVTS